MLTVGLIVGAVLVTAGATLLATWLGFVVGGLLVAALTAFITFDARAEGESS